MEDNFESHISTPKSHKSHVSDSQEPSQVVLDDRLGSKADLSHDEHPPSTHSNQDIRFEGQKGEGDNPDQQVVSQGQSPKSGRFLRDSKVQPLIDENSYKIKRDIQKQFNEVRGTKNLGNLQWDQIAGLIAEDYAEFLKNNEHDVDLLKTLCEEFNNLGDLKIIYGFSNFEEEGLVAETFYEEAVDLGRSFLEVQKDKDVLLSPEINQIGIGVSMTKEKVIIVALLSHKTLCLTEVKELEKDDQKGIEILGKMLVDTDGVYAVRIVKPESKKELVVIGPENVSFNFKTKDFFAFLPLEEGFGNSEKLIEVYTRKKPETIEYELPRKQKINLNHLELAYRCTCVEYPIQAELKKYQEEQATLEQKKIENEKAEEMRRKRREEESVERRELRKTIKHTIEAEGEENTNLNAKNGGMSPLAQKRKKKWIEEQIRIKKEQENQQQPGQRAEDDEIVQFDLETEELMNEGNANEDNNGNTNEELTNEEEVEEMEDQVNFEQPETNFNNTKIKNELDLALEHSRNELSTLENKNLYYQFLIQELKEKKDLSIEKNSEITMTEGKYFNMLSHVHQIRSELKATQDRYNKMARDLQERLEEKQKSCLDIKNSFRGLTREVMKNAVFSKTDKPLGTKKVMEWEEIEDIKTHELQGLRLENIRLRNQLANNLKILKKKEELADGLHLIDYEQLKIENQTLCEKIEERNEDLFKLRKSNTNIVQVFTHVREKLNFERLSNEDLEKARRDLNKDVGSLRTSLNDVKKETKKYRTQNEEIKQQTGIMTNEYLKRDYEACINSIKTNKKTMHYLEEKFDYMTEVIEKYSKKNKWTKVVGSPKKIFI